MDHDHYSHSPAGSGGGRLGKTGQSWRGHEDPEEYDYEYAASDVGGGGWLHSGTFHPLDFETILIGSDHTGGVYRTDNFGESWEPWSEGLSNYDHMWSIYVEDMVGVVEPDGTVAYYAATHGGIYRRPAIEDFDEYDEEWDWMGDDQPKDESDAVSPTESLVYWSNQSGHYHREPISFSCLDWNGENLIAAGAGRVRWGRTWTTDHYPGIELGLLKTASECDPDTINPDYPCNPQLQPIWIHDLDHPENGWQPLEIPEGFGTARDISLTKIDGNNYLAAATHTGLYFYDFSANQWHDLADNLFWNGDPVREPRAMTYGSELTAWSIHLTQRGTLYAAMQRLDSTLASGVYRIYNVPVLLGGSWAWTGDRGPVSPHDSSLWEIGLGEGILGQADLIYLSVADGQGEDPDTLYLGDRRSNYGLVRGEQPLDFTGGQTFIPCDWTASVTQTNWVTWYPSDFDLGIGENWGPQVLFHPAIMPGSSPHTLAVQFNGRMHVSDDGGITWDQRYCIEDKDEDDAWTSLGYNQHCVRGATFLADGRPVFSNVDTGVFAGIDPEGSAYLRINPEANKEGAPTDDTIKAMDATQLHMLPDWNESGKDALFVNYSYRPMLSNYGKLFMQLYNREEGPSNDPEEWYNITKSLLEPDRYVFGDYVFIDDETCFLSYVHYNGTAGVKDIVPDGYGVLRGLFEEYDSFGEPVWTWEDWGDGLPVVDVGSTYVTSMLHNEYRGERIFLAAARNGNEGGLYMMEGPNYNNWEPIYDGDYMDGDGEDCPEDDPDCCPEDGSLCDDLDPYRYRDFRSLAQSEDGSYLYAGTRGVSSGIGGLLLCKDPSNADDMNEWEILANDPDNTIRPFEFYLNIPFWAEDFSYFGASHRIDQNLTSIASLAVDPRDREMVYVGLTDEGFSLREGLWKYDGETWEHISIDKMFEGMAASMLEFNPYVPGQLLIGTDGQGLYIMGEEHE